MKIQRLHAWLVVAALVLSSATLYVWLCRAGGTQGARDVQPDPPLRGDAVRVPGGDPVNPRPDAVSSERLRLRPPLPLPSVAWLDRVSSVEGLDTELVAQALAGDTRAMAAFAELVFRCEAFDPARRDYAPRLVEKAPIGSPERTARETAARLMIAYCATTYRTFAPDGPRDAILEMLREAADQGDLVARAERFFIREDEARLLEVLSTADDPWVVERALGRLVMQRGGPIGQQVDREVFPPSMSLPEVVRIKLAAARWRACELGAPCGPNQAYELLSCLQHGNCSLGMDVRTALRQRELSGRQFELMQKYLAALDARLAEAGVRRFATRPPGG